MGEKKPAKQYGCCGLIALCGVGLLVIGFIRAMIYGPPASQAPPGAVALAPDPGQGVMPEIRSFLESHDELGEASGVEPMPNWAKGKRQRVRFRSGRSLLFYMKEGAVVTVYEDKPGEGRVVVYGKQD